MSKEFLGTVIGDASTLVLEVAREDVVNVEAEACTEDPSLLPSTYE